MVLRNGLGFNFQTTSIVQMIDTIVATLLSIELPGKSTDGSFGGWGHGGVVICVP